MPELRLEPIAYLTRPQLAQLREGLSVLAESSMGLPMRIYPEWDVDALERGELLSSGGLTVSGPPRR